MPTTYTTHATYHPCQIGSGRDYILGLKQYFKDEAKAKGKPNWETIVDDWEVVYGSRHTPQQSNGSDCGVFTSTTANYLAQDLELRFSSLDADNFRRRMTLELLDLQLL